MTENRATVQVHGSCIIKRQSPEHSRIERERTLVGSGVASQSGLFRVPEILSFDDEKGEITFQHVPDAVPLREHLSKRPDPLLMEHVGRALAAIHKAPVPTIAGEVFWHGDYGMRNVLYSESINKITVIDWANANWALEPVEKTIGNPGMDLGVALISLFHQRPFGYMYISKTEALGASFLKGYQRERNCFGVPDVLPFISDLILRRRRYWISQRGVLRNFAHDPSLIRLRLFLMRSRSRMI